MILVSSANNIASEKEFILRNRSFICIKTIKVPEMSLGKLLVSLDPSQRNKYELH
jgi:hypothetical protein